MKKLPHLLGLVFLVLLVSTPLGADPEDGRARIALFEPVCKSSDPALAAVLVALTDTVELSIACLDRYAIQRLPPADPSADLKRIRAYCAENRIDQAIGGTASARKEGGYSFRLVVYDRLKDSVTLIREAASMGALDMFDVTDALVASLLDGLSGSHLLFGSLEVESEPPGAAISVNGQDAGVTPATLRSIPAGHVQIVAKAEGWEEAGAPAVIEDGVTASVVLKLVRSAGSLQFGVPQDASLTVIGQDNTHSRVGPGIVADLPTGNYEVKARCPGLADAFMRVLVERNRVTSCRPWTAGYLSVESDPPGASILVDGIEKGASPGVVEVEAGKSHLVELKMAKYQVASVEASAEAGTKNPIAVTLVLLHGSISIETDVPHADVLLDGTIKGQSPCVFGNLTPGEHTIKICDVLQGKKFLTCGQPENVIVRPDEVTAISRTFHRGAGTLVIAGAPKGSTLLIDGVKINSPEVFTTGIEVPAGIVEIVVSGGMFQRWTGTATLASDVTNVVNTSNLTRR
jgi:hypothetical protein